MRTEDQNVLRLMHMINDCNGTQTHNHLVHKRTLNHLAKLVLCL